MHNEMRLDFRFCRSATPSARNNLRLRSEILLKCFAYSSATDNVEIASRRPVLFVLPMLVGSVSKFGHSEASSFHLSKFWKIFFYLSSLGLDSRGRV